MTLRPLKRREPMPDDDRELMLDVQRGVRTAFEELVARYEVRLVSYFYRQGGDRDLAEDCAQEVFVRLYRSRHRYGPHARFSTFLFTIARNHWIDIARARRVRPTELSASARDRDDGAEDRTAVTTTEDPGPMRQASTIEETARLRRALGRLPSGQRDAVMLGVIEGLPYSEVAQILGVPIGTVKSRVHAAVQSLRHLLGVHVDPAPSPRRAGGQAS